MKGFVTKIIALLLIVWYSMSIIGFDVHTCKGSGKSFVVSFVEGLECEDIHPEHKCDKDACCADCHSSCCHGEDGVTICSTSCCSNDYQVLVLTGTVSSEDDAPDNVCACGHYLCIAGSLTGLMSRLQSYGRSSHLLQQGPGVLERPDLQSAFGVWRI